ncbi:hypothetical protein VP01_694g1 [Puccinia sorghi]|uniref:Uncharacterized protein n=1 Tax=Puccinia sorghi TaxID=27349 RepID=A0A0L6UE44_9BASI|nr:hypothetical protein VP01_694g1 [Puccinia sorghi]
MIQGEPILCQFRERGEYWPVLLLGPATLDSLKQKTQLLQQRYSVKFCNQTTANVPCSFFLNLRELGFYSAQLTFFFNFWMNQIGQLVTIGVLFEVFHPELLDFSKSLDSIVSSDTSPEVAQMHNERYLNGNCRSRLEIPKGIGYGSYDEEVIVQVSRYLVERYIYNFPRSMSLGIDKRFLDLSPSQKIRYVNKILTLEVCVLITITKVDEAVKNGTSLDPSHLCAANIMLNKQ